MRRGLAARWLIPAVWALACLNNSLASAAPERVFPRVETGVHEGAINDATLVPGSGLLLTVSDDKTARLWSLDKLTPAGVIRPPVGSADIGAIYSSAASDKAIALGGRLRDNQGRYGVALYLRSDLSSAGVLWGFPAAVTALRFSATGRMLAVGMQGGAGFRVLDLVSNGTAFRDVVGGTVTGLDYDGQGRLAVASDDGAVRLYGADGQPVKLPPLPKGSIPWRIAFSPDGGQLAIGDRRQASVHVLDLRKMKYEPDLRGAQTHAGSLEIVAYSLDGKTLFAGGSYIDKTGQVFVRQFPIGPGGPGAGVSDIKLTRQLVTDLVPLADGLIVTTADPAILRLDRAGKVSTAVRSNHPDFRSGGLNALLVSQDGAVVDLPGISGTRLRFDAVQHAIMQPDGRPMLRPFTTARGLSVTQWLNDAAPRVNGQLVPLGEGETARAAAVLPDGTGAAIGTDFYVRLVRRSGEVWKVETEAPVWAVNASGDGRLVIAALGDGTVHWYDIATGRELLALLIDPPTKRFVIWTSEGYFDHDHQADGGPDGRGLIGHRFNTASGSDSQFVQIGQLYPLFFRPDLVGLTFRNDAASQQRLAEQTRMLGSVAMALAGGLPARVTLLGACPATAGRCGPAAGSDGTTTDAIRTGAEQVLIRYRLDDTVGMPGAVTLTRNGVVMRAEPRVRESGPQMRVEEVLVALVAGSNTVRIAPVSANGAVEATDGESAVLTVDRRGPEPAFGALPVPRGPIPAGTVTTTVDVPFIPAVRRLFVLSVGVGEFLEPTLDFMGLPNAGADASAVADVFASPSPPVYDAPIVVRLVGKNATRPRIVAALQEIANQARPDDMAVIFFAGHGLSVDGRYYYAAGDLARGDTGRLNQLLHPKTEAAGEAMSSEIFEQYGLSQEVLLQLLQSIQASRVAIILDTCYSATAATGDAVLRRDLNTTVTNRLGHASGRFVLSSAFRQAADSGGEGMSEHGLFTSYLLQAFEGAADLEQSGLIDIYKLANYMRRSVVTHSREMATRLNRDELMQEPSFYFAGSDFFALRAVSPGKAAP